MQNAVASVQHLSSMDVESSEDTHRKLFGNVTWTDLVQNVEKLNPSERAALHRELKKILPAKYQFKFDPPVIFLSTRTGTVGSALFNIQDAKGEGNGPLIPEVTHQDAQSLVERLNLFQRIYACGSSNFTGKSDLSTLKQNLRYISTMPSTTEIAKANSALSLCGRKYVVFSRSPRHAHGRYLHNSPTQGEQHGIYVALTSHFLVVYLYEKPMHSFDAEKLVLEVQKCLDNFLSE
eukprot:g1512.t1